MFLQPKTPFLSGQILMSFPGRGKEGLEQNLVFVCKHNQDGAIGFVLGHALHDVSLTYFIYQNILHEGGDLSFADYHSVMDPPVFWGGPLESSHGFILHSLDCDFEHTLSLNEDYGISTHMEILQSLVSPKPPEDFRAFLGYTGWRAGELEQEIKENMWIPLPFQRDVVFDLQPPRTWHDMAASLGIDAHHMTYLHGKA